MDLVHVKRCCLAGSAQKCDLVRQEISLGLGHSMKESKYKLAFLGEIRKRQCPEPEEPSHSVRALHIPFLEGNAVLL